MLPTEEASHYIWNQALNVFGRSFIEGDELCFKMHTNALPYHFLSGSA